MSFTKANICAGVNVTNALRSTTCIRVLSGKSAGAATVQPVNFAYGKNRGKIAADCGEPQGAL